MLRRVSIHGFKSIRQKTTVELGRVNLFIGGNGVGKSNILEAIGVLSSCLGADITSNELQKKGVRLSVPTLFKSAFKNHDLRSSFSLTAEWESGLSYEASISAGETSEELSFLSEQLKANGVKKFGRSNHGFTFQNGFKSSNIGTVHPVKELRKTRGMWDLFQEILDLSPDMSAELETLSQFVIYSPHTAFLRGTDVESNPIKPIGLNGGGLASAVNKVFSSLRRNEKDIEIKLKKEIINLVWAPGWTDQIKVDRRDETVSTQVITEDSTLYFRDKFMKAKRNMLSAYDSSEGTLYLLFIVVILLHPEAPKIFALDNVDNALNPAITKNLLDKIIKSTTYKEYQEAGIGPRQVFLTSHNPTSLDAFDIFDDEQRIFVVSRDENGSTIINRLKPNENMTREDWIKKTAGKNLSEMWISGKIDGALGI